MINLALRKKETNFTNVEKELLSVFFSKSSGKSNKEFRFSKIDSHFTDFLPHINDGAIKLYLYYIMVANSQSGESWYSTSTISQKLSATERSIGNWNNELEKLGLIFRTNSGKKSKTTYVLPLTSFSVKMNTQKINQILTQRNLYDSNENSKVFGKFQSLTKLYLVNKDTQAIVECYCVHLKRTSTVKDITINSVDIYLYTEPTVVKKNIEKNLSTYDANNEVVIVHQSDEKPPFNQSVAKTLQCFFINIPCKIDDSSIYDIMDQLTDNVDGPMSRFSAS